MTIPSLKAVDLLQVDFGFSSSDLAAALGTSEYRLSQLRSGDASPPEPSLLARLTALESLVAELRRAFRGDDECRAWLDVKVPTFDGLTPRKLIVEGSVQRVATVLYALNAGAAL